jgi:exodeoxyribonuclease V alpha subunit
MTTADYKKTSRCLDKQFAAWILRHFSAQIVQENNNSQREILRRVAEATSYATYMKHSCLDMEKYTLLNDPVLNDLLAGITPEKIRQVLQDNISPLVSSREGNKIWLQKYDHFEHHLAQDLLAMNNAGRLELITGGPGTGKTWTAAQRIQQTLNDNPACVIALAAPTGKAANNMMVALTRAGLAASQHNLKALTLHSLLGMGSQSPQPRRNREHPLNCDLLVIDEASMIDLPMMTRVLQALPPQAHLLLLGDKDQLASVEAGSVLHEICSATAFANCITTLTESRRYRDSPEVGALATALNQGLVPDLSVNHKVRLHTLPTENPWQPPWLEAVAAHYRQWHHSLLGKAFDNSNILAALEQQKQFQILCALREGPQGVSGINAMIEKSLQHHRPQHHTDSWYVGKPLMITANDHEHKLYNGDVGLVLAVDGQLKACFHVDGKVKIISAAQMPACETAYAITVHKSQGSEYRHVLIVLPAELAAARNNTVLTRELVYTAVTRAKDSVDLWCGKGVLENAAAKTLQRMSGLGVKW